MDEKTPQEIKPRKQSVTLSPQVLAKYLGALAASGLQYQSAAISGVTARAIQKRMKSDPAFSEECEEARGLYRDLLEEEADRRGRVGWEERTIEVGPNGVLRRVTKTKKDGAILLAMLRAHVPEYRLNKVELNVAAGGVLVVPAAIKDSEEWRRRANGEHHERVIDVGEKPA